MARWSERDHPRNPKDGRFIERGGGLAAWAGRISDLIGRRRGGGEHPHVPEDVAEHAPPVSHVGGRSAEMERVGLGAPSGIREHRVRASVDRLRGEGDYGTVVRHLDEAALTRAELDAVGHRLGVDMSGTLNRDEAKALHIARMLSAGGGGADLNLQGLKPVGMPDMPDGYEFDATWAASHRDALASGHYEVFMGGDWDVPQLVVRMPGGVVRIVGQSGSTILRPGDTGNVRPYQE